MYTIGEDVYEFTESLVIGQYRQLLEVEFDDIDIPTDEHGKVIATKELLCNLISKVPSSKILSILLKPQSTPLWEKDISTLEKEIEFSLSPHDVDSMLNDFFALCPLDNVMEGMITLAKVNQSLARVT